MGLVWHDPVWKPEDLPIDAAGTTRPGFVCVHELENGSGRCGGNVFDVDQAVGRHCCHVDDFAERLKDELGSPCPCGSGLSSLRCKEH